MLNDPTALSPVLRLEDEEDGGGWAAMVCELCLSRSFAFTSRMAEEYYQVR